MSRPRGFGAGWPGGPLNLPVLLTPSTQPINSWADLRAPRNGTTYIDNVLTVQNNSVDASGNKGNAAVRVVASAAEGGWERCAFGYSSDVGPGYYPGTSYWEIFASNGNDMIYPDAAITVTHVPGSAGRIFPAGIGWRAFEVKGDYGTVRINRNNNANAVSVDGTTGEATFTDAVMRIHSATTGLGAAFEARARSDGNGSLGRTGQGYFSRWRTDAKQQGTAGGDPLYSGLGTLAFGGNHTDGSAANILYAASLGGYVETDFNSAANMPTGLIFRTGAVGVAVGAVNVQPGTPRMWLTSAGRLGIGAQQPGGLLAVAGGMTVGNNIKTITPPTDGMLVNGFTGLSPSGLFAFGATGPQALLHLENGGIYVGRANARSAMRNWLVTAESNQDNDGFVYTRSGQGATYLSYVAGGSVIANDGGSIFLKTAIAGNDPTTGTTRLEVQAGNKIVLGGSPSLTWGAAAPAATEPSGSLYIRTAGATGTRLYVSAGAGTWNAVAGV